MAEFQEVARHWKRMCNKYWRSTTCHGCPIAEHERSYEACSNIDVNVSIMEEIVMKWAAEHPEPKYPTWWEYMCMIGVIPDELGDKTLGEMTVYSLMNTHIQSDTAQKLGLEPRRQ